MLFTTLSESVASSRSYRVAAFGGSLALLTIAVLVYTVATYEPPQRSLFSGVLFLFFFGVSFVTLVESTLLAACTRWGRDRPRPRRLLVAGTLGSALGEPPTILSALVLRVPASTGIFLAGRDLEWYLTGVGWISLFGAMLLPLVGTALFAAGSLWYGTAAVRERL